MRVHVSSAVRTRFGCARARVDCEFCSRRWTVISTFGWTGEPIRCCKTCYIAMKEAEPSPAWTYEWRIMGKCNGVTH